MLAQIPLAEFGEDSDIAHTVAFLASEKLNTLQVKQFMSMVACICNL